MGIGGLHRVLRDLTGRGDLGLHQRSLSQPRALQGAESGQFDALDYERDYFGPVSSTRRQISGTAILVVCSHDGADVLRSAVHVSRDEGRYAGTDAAQAGD